MFNLKAFLKTKYRILTYIDLMQDFDVLFPLIQTIHKCQDLTIKVLINKDLTRESPRIEKNLNHFNIPYSIISHRFLKFGLGPSLFNIDIIITASESTAKPHHFSHLLTKRANKKGLLTYTLQHGWENIGLTYFDDDFTPNNVNFASQKILIWGTEDSLLPDVHQTIKRRCISVGCPKETAGITTTEKLPILRQNAFLISIFENLHWNRYDNNFREQFIQDLISTSTQFPNTTFLVKPHHAGQWLTKRYKGSKLQKDNIIIIDPADSQWEPYTAPALIKYSDGIFTTPSTVALDSANLNQATCIIGYELDLPKYTPLPIIHSSADWINYVQQIQDLALREQLQQKATAFFEKSIVPGNAIERILSLIRADIQISQKR